jgi:two-component system, cell cycle sensor histidine kinase and response regulator CckA
MQSTLRLLLLEDTPLDAELTLAALEEAGYTVQPQLVGDRAAFLRQLDAPAFDLIIADYSLPAFDGLTALRLTRDRALDIPFILLSGTVGEELAIESLKAGATDYVMKQRIDRLAPVVQRALREARQRDEQRQAASERRRLEEQLQRAQRMEVVGRLAGGIAHDFNNLLSVIIGNVQMARLDLPAGDGVQLYLADVESAAGRAARLTRQLLAFSRRQSLEQHVVNLNDLLGDMIKMLRPLIGEDIDVRLHPAGDLLPVFVDAAQIEQVVMNLALNARDAMAAGGRLAIETANVPQEHTGVGGPLVRLTVSDTGSGIGEALLPHIFEPFFTTKEEGKGTGLGLAVVYGIIQQHNGQIEVESREGVGTAFHVYLPAAGTPVTTTGRDESLALYRGSETVLLAEDEPLVREMTRSALVRFGYSVELASDGREALQKVLSGAPFDLLLLDVVMPSMGGWEVFERTRAANIHTPVVFMTGHSAELAGHRVPPGPGVLFVQKPFRLDDLGRELRRALEQR